MTLRELQHIYQKRRSDLVDLLEHGGLDAAKQHQVYGAILEIDTLLKTLKHYLEKDEDDVKFKLRR